MRSARETGYSAFNGGKEFSTMRAKVGDNCWFRQGDLLSMRASVANCISIFFDPRQNLAQLTIVYLHPVVAPAHT